MVLTSAISFPVTVNNRPLMVTSVEEVEDLLYKAFHLRFSDGYEDTFYCIDHNFIEGKKKKTSYPYAKAIEKDLFGLSFVEKDRFHHVFQYNLNATPVNVWVAEFQSDIRGLVYIVLYDGDYRFELKKIGNQWIRSSARKINPDKIDPVLAKKIEFLIDSHL